MRKSFIILALGLVCACTATAASTIYLLGEYHDNADDKTLLAALGYKASAKKLILGVESPNGEELKGPDLRCTVNRICNLDATNSAFVASFDDPHAWAIAHLLYFYSKLIRLEMFEQIMASPYAEKELKDIVKSNTLPVWEHELCTLSLIGALWMLSASDKEWEMWQQVSKGPRFTALTKEVARLRKQGKQDMLDVYQDLAPSKFFKYSKGAVLGFLEELPPVLSQLIKQTLASREAQSMPAHFKNKLKNMSQLLKTARPVDAWDITGFQTLTAQEKIISGELADRLREFFIAHRATELSEKAEQMNVPFVMVSGLDHTPGIYMFLKQMGASVEVGLKENFLKLNQKLAKLAKFKTLPNLLLKQQETNLGIANDILAYLDEDRDADPEAEAALEALRVYRQAF